MRHPTFITPAVLALAWSLTAGPALAQDPVVVAPQNHKVLLENERVRVIEFRSKPGDKIVMHEHPAYIVYDIRPGRLKITKPDGTSRTDPGDEAGEATWQEAGAHALENVGDTETVALLVELKDGGTGHGGMRHGEMEPGEMEHGEHGKVEERKIEALDEGKKGPGKNEDEEENDDADREGAPK